MSDDPHRPDDQYSRVNYRRLIASLHDVLLPGGLLLIQILNYEGFLATGKRCLPVNLRPGDDGKEIVFLRTMSPGEDGRVLAARGAARQQLPTTLWSRARRLLDQLQRVHVLGDMAQPPGNRLERLSDGRHSVRINDQYRVTFRWKDGAAEEVWCGDYHD